jgi:hypothetical protein
MRLYLSLLMFFILVLLSVNSMFAVKPSPIPTLDPGQSPPR